MDSNLIDQTCKQTPNYDLCVSSLQSDPRSSDADVKGLGLIMADVVKSKVTDALNRINELLKQSPGDQAFCFCIRIYNAVLQTDIQQADEGFTEGDSKIAEQSMNKVAIKADSCESDFSSSSPLIDKNKAVQDSLSLTLLLWLQQLPGHCFDIF